MNQKQISLMLSGRSPGIFLRRDQVEYTVVVLREILKRMNDLEDDLSNFQKGFLLGHITFLESCLEKTAGAEQGSESDTAPAASLPSAPGGK